MKRVLIAIAAAATAMLAGAQAYPGSKPITFVVPFAAGGPTDRVARDLAVAMAKTMPGGNFVVENVNGAGGTIGATGALPVAGTELPDWILVCDRGRWRGLIDDAPLRDLPVQRWDSEQVGDHLRPLSSLASIAESAPLWQAALELEHSPRLLVLSPAGLPCGTIERPELGEAVLRRLGLRLPAPLLANARRQSGYPLGLALGQIAKGMVGTGEVGSAQDGNVGGASDGGSPPRPGGDQV